MKNLNKKGGTTEFIVKVIGILIMAIVVGAYITILGLVSNARSATVVQLETISHKVLYDSSVIMYVDDLGRVYPGVIDIQKFNEEQLKQSLNYTAGPLPAMKLSLQRQDLPALEIFLNQNQFERLIALSADGLSGLGTTKSLHKSMPLLYRQDDTLHEGILDMTIVVVRS